MTAAHTPPAAPPTFDEMRAVLAAFPGPDRDAAAAAAARQKRLVKPPGALGRLEGIAVWLATWQARVTPRLGTVRLGVFAGAHGVAARGVSVYPPDLAPRLVKSFIDGGTAAARIAEDARIDLNVYELDLAHPTRDFTQGPAMDEAGCARAMAYGMMAVEPGIDLLCLGEFGVGATTSAAALCCALFGGAPEDWVGPGSGVGPDRVARKAEIVAAGLAANPGLEDPLAMLAAFGGPEMAAVAGAVMAARMARTPVLLDGFVATAAAAVLTKLAPGALDHCLVAQMAGEPGHRRLCDELGKEPLLDLGLRLGEGTGAALAVPLVRAALACHLGMAMFAGEPA